MTGTVYIERENTDGDRRIVRTFDVEGMSGPIEPIIHQALTDVLHDPATYIVRAFHESQGRYRLWMSQVTGQDLRQARL